MQNKCSKSFMAFMILVQVCLVVFIFSKMLETDFFTISNLSYILGVGVVVFAIGFFSFSLKSCLCHQKKQLNSDTQSSCGCNQSFHKIPKNT